MGFEGKPPYGGLVVVVLVLPGRAAHALPPSRARAAAMAAFR